MAHQVGKYDVATETDMRTLPGYQPAKTTHTLVVTEPSINPDTGFPVIALRFRSFAALNSSVVHRPTSRGCPVTLSRPASRQRREHHIVADRTNGKIIAFPDKQKGVRIENGALKIATMVDIDDARGARSSIASMLARAPIGLSSDRPSTERI